MPRSSSTTLFQKFSVASKKLSVTAETLADFTYGATVGAHVIGEVMQHPLMTSGMEDSILASIPLVGMGLSVLRMIVLSTEMYKYGEVVSFRQLENTTRFFSSLYLFDFFRENRSQIMSVGATTFGLACDYFAFQALLDFIVACRNFYEAREEMLAPDMYGYGKQGRIKAYNRTAEDLAISALKLMGWGALAAAHLPACAAAAPVLLGVGSTCLVASALYVGGKATYGAYYSLFPSDSTAKEKRAAVDPSSERERLLI